MLGDHPGTDVWPDVEISGRIAPLGPAYVYVYSHGADAALLQATCEEHFVRNDIELLSFGGIFESCTFCKG